MAKYHHEREVSAIRVAAERGYFLDPTEEFLLANFVTGFEEYNARSSIGTLLPWKKSPDIGYVEWVNLHASHLRYLGDLPLCRNMCICVLSDNYLYNIAPLVSCYSLVKLDLHNNQISRLPGAEFWRSLGHLQILYLHDNPIGKFSAVTQLHACSQLMALTLHNTPISLRPNYRHHIVNSISSLKVLDSYMVSDEEIIEDSKFSGRFATFHSSLYIHRSHTREGPSYDRELHETLELLHTINTRHAHTSPVLIIQRYLRGYLTRKALLARPHLLTPSLVNGEATLKVMSSLLVSPSPEMVTSKGMFPKVMSPLLASPSPEMVTSKGRFPKVMSPLLASPSLEMVTSKARFPSDLIMMASDMAFRTGRRLVINLAKLETDTLASLEKDSEAIDTFMKESASRRLKKIPPVIPVKKRSRKEKAKKVVAMDVKDFLGPIVTSKPTEEVFDDVIPFTKYRLQGKPHSLCLNDRTAELFYTTRDVANDIRTEEEFFHELTAKAPRPPRQFNKVSTISERMFARGQRNMNLAPLWAVQKAYDDRIRTQKINDRAERCNMLKEKRDHVLNNVYRIRDEQRRSIVNEKQNTQWILQDNLERNVRNNRKRLNKKQENRCQSSSMTRAHKQEEAFMRAFSSQQASVSNALLLHDHASRNDQHHQKLFNTAQEQRFVEMDKHDTVKRYMEHRQHLLQGECSQQRGALNSRMLEDANDRIIKAKMRIERLKSKRKTSEDYHRSKPLSLQLECNDVRPAMQRHNTVAVKA